MRRILLLLTVFMATVATASAYAELGVKPEIQNIDIGTTASYTVTLNTSDTGAGSLVWKTSDSAIKAAIVPEALDTVGVHKFTNTPGVAQTFTLQVQPQSGAVAGKEYEIEVDYGGVQGKIKAMVTAGVVPVPELPSVVLTSAGVLGMIGLVRMRRKD